ncbi:hypothetical protein FRC04_001605 [Tulasnella sp. 424]|nr:hypothetical protein FRC04_001605 [Tulasnella sp. 424]KAG8971370.1 hypothetical protein FRC05_011132 [Tulasnella sp. 425]
MKLTQAIRRDFPVHPTVESDLSTTSAAHRTFAIEELQYSIFSHLLVFYALSSKPDERQDALVAVALTCQSFLDVALNILYDHITLFRLLQVWHGRGVLKRVNQPGTLDKYITFDRVPNASDRQRFEFYSRRVRTLEVPHRSGNVQLARPADSFGADFFPTIGEVIAIRGTARTNLFPELRSLMWGCDLTGDDFVVCQAIIQLSPRLKSFTYTDTNLRPPVPASTWPIVLLTLASTHSLEVVKLETTSLGPVGLGTGAGLALSSLLSNLHIKQLLLPEETAMSTSLLSRLATAQELQKLTFWPSDAQVVVTERTEEPGTLAWDRLTHLAGSSRALLRLILTGGSPFQALTTLASTAGSEWGSEFSWSLARTFISLLGERCPILQNIRVEIEIEAYVADPERVGGFVLAPLRACPRIQRLYMVFETNSWDEYVIPDDFNPTDQDWRSLVPEWPDLREMQYDVGDPPFRNEKFKTAIVPAPRATIKSIAAFGRSCRHLKALALPITATLRDTDATLLDDILPFSDSLHYIDFSRASIEETAVQEMAALLVRLTHNDVDLYPEERNLPNRIENERLDIRRERNWQAVQKLVRSNRRAQL